MSTTKQPVSPADPGADDAEQEFPAAAGVRWKRFGAMFALTGAMAAGLVALTAQGVLAAGFSISGMPFVVTADKLDGTGFEQFATIDETEPLPGEDPEQKVLIVSAINTATLTNLCQSVDMVGGYLKITAGDAGEPVSAKTLLVDSDLITGNASFNKINIGQDSSTLDQVPGVVGNRGVFGQQADHVQILNLRQNNFATTAVTFKLPHLRMTFTPNGC
jgi:hypothetical protein